LLSFLSLIAIAYFAACSLLTLPPFFFLIARSRFARLFDA
jgi:hypothetical protein